MAEKVTLDFTVNGERKTAHVWPMARLLDVLREELQLTGTKEGCGEGECGACTIQVDGVSLNSCLMFAVDCDGREVTTIEGLANDPQADALRDAFVEHGAVQCGFCTPGMVMQADHILHKHEHPDEGCVKRGLEGNLCRCTGYKKIVDAVIACGAAE